MDDDSYSDLKAPLPTVYRTMPTGHCERQAPADALDQDEVDALADALAARLLPQILDHVDAVIDAALKADAGVMPDADSARVS